MDQAVAAPAFSVSCAPLPLCTPTALRQVLYRGSPVAAAICWLCGLTGSFLLLGHAAGLADQRAGLLRAPSRKMLSLAGRIPLVLGIQSSSRVALRLHPSAQLGCHAVTDSGEPHVPDQVPQLERIAAGAVQLLWRAPDEAIQ